MSSLAPAPLLVAPAALAAADARARVRFVDASWFMPGSPRRPRDEWAAARLPGARFLDLDAVASAHPLGLKHMLPPAADFARACEEFGVAPDTHVVLYDSHGVFSAPRALYMFRAFGHTNSSVLDGGLPAWRAASLPIDSTPPAETVERTQYAVPTLDESVVKSYEQMVANAEVDPTQDASASLVLDARPAGRFHGTDPEPRPGLPSGHMPHSCSLPFNLFRETVSVPGGESTYTVFRSAEGIAAALEAAVGKQNAEDIRAGRRAVTLSCGSGMTACILWLGLRILGVTKTAVYDESWAGYAARKESKIIKDA